MDYKLSFFEMVETTMILIKTALPLAKNEEAERKIH